MEEKVAVVESLRCSYSNCEAEIPVGHTYYEDTTTGVILCSVCYDSTAYTDYMSTAGSNS